MSKSDSELEEERSEEAGLANAASLLLVVVNDLLGKIESFDPSLPETSVVQVATVNVRAAMSCLSHGLAGDDKPSTFYGHLSRVLGECSLNLRKFEEDLKESNGQPPTASVH